MGKVYSKKNRTIDLDELTQDDAKFFSLLSATSVNEFSRDFAELIDKLSLCDKDKKSVLRVFKNSLKATYEKHLLMSADIEGISARIEGVVDAYNAELLLIEGKQLLQNEEDLEVE